MQYPDGVAYLDCLKTADIEPQESFIIRAKGRDSPRMRVRINGKQVYQTFVNNTDYRNILINSPVGTGILDIIFLDLDSQLLICDDTKAKIDRNLYIDYVAIGDVKINLTGMTMDNGAGMEAFDCEELRDSYALLTNGALRVKLK